jgi:hypothetical protein
MKIKQIIREIELELENLSRKDPLYDHRKELLTEELEALRTVEVA